MQARLAPLHELFSSGKLSQADFVAAYIITYLSYRFPKNWPGARTGQHKIPGTDWRILPLQLEANVLERLKDTHSIQEIFANFALKSTPLSVNRAILEWANGRYGLELMFRIPSPREILDQQKVGRRCVTTLLDKRIHGYILGERDSLSFTMHDLIHADHFYHNNQCYQGQLGLYGLLDKTFSYFDLSHDGFKQEFEYIIADMNAYAIHLLKCLKSAMIHYFNDDYFVGWATMVEAPKELFALNTTDYDPASMDHVLLSWLDSFRQIEV